jgi:hypothetical protein
MDEDVGRLQVAVDDAFLVRMLHALADADEQREALVARQRVAAAIVGNRDAFDILHRDEGVAFRRGAGVEDLCDGRVLHLRQGLALDFEPGQRERTGDLLADQLEGNVAMDRRRLLGQVNLAHATFAKGPADPVRTELHAGLEHRRIAGLARHGLEFGGRRRRRRLGLGHPLPPQLLAASPVGMYAARACPRVMPARGA